MRTISFLSASALVLALGVASASAQPRTEDVMNHGNFGVSQTYSSGAILQEGRSAAIDTQAPANVLIDQSRHAGR